MSIDENIHTCESLSDEVTIQTVLGGSLQANFDENDSETTISLPTNQQS